MGPAPAKVVTLDTSAVNAILKAHNDIRKSHGVPPLVWDKKIAKHAVGWAAHSMKFTNFQATDGDNGNPHHGDHAGYGQNLAWKYSSSPFKSIPFASLVALWNSEPIPTTPGTYNHVTQVLWKTTKSVGCAVAAGPNPHPDPSQPAYLNDIILVCDYYPPGNYYGQQWNTATKLTKDQR
ncbi:PR-1-like protein [Rhizoclosmatium globosum]|uniref:PR-1-like protein n=1 Tax=Rhizoclosmatium globosum TaxID=329046 RepID=A0A1Y2D1J7_9FUNG|nr:PR-1-like protein [Rhizoclosmatium globosum]|eukprot:ORY52986.1 PR-1-like protein [Rhizoclosmatium globosum]